MLTAKIQNATLCLEINAKFIENPQKRSFLKMPENGTYGPVRPVHYGLILEPDFEKFITRGTVSIDLDLEETAPKIVLNGKNVEINTVCLTKNNTLVETNEPEYDTEKETILISAKGSAGIPPGKANLILAFESRIGNDGLQNKDTLGFYMCHPEDKSIMAATQFESTFARKAFPCFDHPMFKSTFHLTLTAPGNTIVVSNTPEEIAIPVGEKTMFMFEKTPPMPVYTLAWAVGNFDSIETVTQNGTEVRVLTEGGKIKSGEIALETAVKALESLEEYFGIPYELPKLDLLAIPDFSYGAMENWGIIIFRDVALLADEKSSIRDIDFIKEVIIHEIVHMWLGNLVTMADWNDLWLNEGTTEYITALTMDKLFPKTRCMEKKITRRLNDTLATDSYPQTHPLKSPPEDNITLENGFTEIIFGKGFIVTRMIAETLGENFRPLLKKYLEKFSYKNTSWLDFLETMSENGAPMKKIAESWITKPGFPLVCIEENNPSQITLSQKRFFSDGDNREDDALWQIPLNLYIPTSKNPKQTIYLTKKCQKFKINTKCKKESGEIPLVINPDTKTPARVLYKESMRKHLSFYSLYRKISSPLTRISILNDMSAIAGTCAGTIEPEEIMSLLDDLVKSEKDPLVRLEITDTFRKLSSFIPRNEITRIKFNLFARDALKPIFRELGWEKKTGEDENETALRSALTEFLGEANDENIIVEARELFELICSKSECAIGEISPDIRQSVYSITAKTGGKEELDVFLKLYAETQNPHEQNRLLYTMGFFTGQDEIEKVINFAFSEQVKTHNAIRPFYAFRENPNAIAPAWEFFSSNWEEMEKKFLESGHMGGFISAIVPYMENRDILEKAEKFLNEKIKTPAIKRHADMAILKARTLIKRRKKNSTGIDKWLTNWYVRNFSL
jgi:aminopeptidase N